MALWRPRTKKPAQPVNQEAAATNVATPKAKSVFTVGRFRRPITIGLGCGIPCLSLALSSQGGELLAAGEIGLGIASLVLCCTVLALSLSHLRDAIVDITHCDQWQGWVLAVAVDCALVLAELVQVSGHGSLVQWGLLGLLTFASAVLNCWAFLRHNR
jgi:hypothetical protein